MILVPLDASLQDLSNELTILFILWTFNFRLSQTSEGVRLLIFEIVEHFSIASKCCKTSTEPLKHFTNKKICCKLYKFRMKANRAAFSFRNCETTSGSSRQKMYLPIVTTVKGAIKFSSKLSRVVVRRQGRGRCIVASLCLWVYTLLKSTCSCLSLAKTWEK